MMKSHQSVRHQDFGNSLNDATKHFMTAGDILNYPYSFESPHLHEEAIALDNKLAKKRYEEKYKLAEIQNQ